MVFSQIEVLLAIWAVTLCLSWLAGRFTVSIAFKHILILFVCFVSFVIIMAIGIGVLNG